jgi:hypothetical protein
MLKEELEKLDVRKELMGDDFYYNEQEHQDYTKSWFESLSFEMNNIYLDLAMLRDIRLSTLLYITQDLPNHITYIKQNLAKYDQRIQDENIFEYFPEYEYLKGKYTRCINDTSLHPYLWTISPITFLLPMLAYITDLGRKSAVMHQRVYTANFFINTYPYQVDLRLLKLLKKQFAYIYPNYTFNVLFKPYEKLDKTLCDSIDMFFIENIFKCLRLNMSLLRPLFDTNEYQNKRISSPKRSDISVPLLYNFKNQPIKQERSVDSLFTELEGYLQLSCYFEYFTPIILIEEDFQPSKFKQNFISFITKLLSKDDKNS